MRPKKDVFGFEGPGQHTAQELEQMLTQALTKIESLDLECENLNMWIRLVSRKKTKEAMDEKISQGQHLLRPFRPHRKTP